MKDVLEFILKNIVTLPDEVVVVEENVDDTINYVVTVNVSDVGRIIGKEGKVIKAIRTIMRVIAIQKGVHVRVSVVSETQGESSSNEQLEQSEPVVVAEEAPTNDLSVEV